MRCGEKIEVPRGADRLRASSRLTNGTPVGEVGRKQKNHQTTPFYANPDVWDFATEPLFQL